MTEKELIAKFDRHKNHGGVTTYVWTSDGEPAIVELVCKCGETLARIDGWLWKRLKGLLPDNNVHHIAREVEPFSFEEKDYPEKSGW